MKTETNPDLHIVADGDVITPLLCVNDQYSFILPKGTRHVVLASRADRPTNVVRYMNDRRMLGIAVVSITLRGRRTGDLVVFAADHLPAGKGWHNPENSLQTQNAPGSPQTLRRWTDGAGELWFEPLPDARIIDVRLGGSTTYIVETAEARGLG